MRTYVVTGATGNTGKPITLGLLEKGYAVRIISRSPEKAKELTGKGAQLFVGDSSQPGLLKKALDGADAIYAMIPFNMHASDYFAFQMSHVNAMKEALEANHTPYAVTLSSIGTHLKSGAGVVQGLQRMEESFDTIPGLNVMHLRAAYFMENTLAQVGAVKHMGVMASPLKGDLPMPVVATKDIAAMALNYLTSLSFEGKNHNFVLGPRDVTYEEIALIYGKAIGKPDLKYHTVSTEDGAKAMMQMGMGESVVNRLVEFTQRMNEGKILDNVVRLPANTTPTTVEEFSAVFKMVYEMN
jgi:uncharacterized protein YbjT (DUF2867 family)